jgi:SulP family sulfate permease
MDAGVLVVTGFSAIVFGLDQAILIGVALSILLFVPRAAKLRTSELVVDDDEVVREKLSTDPPNAGFLIFDLEGELFFGAAPEFGADLRSN